MSESPKYLTAQQVADRYGMNIRWVYGCRSLPRRKLGKSLRFLESDLETWEKRHTGNTRVFTFHHFETTAVIRKHRDYPPATRGKDGEAFALLFDMEEPAE